MKTVRITISLPDDLYDGLSRVVGSKNISRLIAETFDHSLKEHRNTRLAAEYEAASREISTVNAELAATVGDGVE